MRISLCNSSKTERTCLRPCTVPLRQRKNMFETSSWDSMVKDVLVINKLKITKQSTQNAQVKR